MSEKDIKLTAEELKDEALKEVDGGIFIIKEPFICPKCKKDYSASAYDENPKCPACGHRYYDRFYTL